MPSQQVIEKLKDLQDALDTISSAVKHIDDASKVAETASEIIKKLPYIINDIKTIEEKHRTELLRDHKERIGSLENHLQNLLSEFKEKSKPLDSLIIETKLLQNDISNYFAELKKIKFPERLDKIDNQITAINIGIGNLQTANQNLQTKVDVVQSSVISIGASLEKRFSDFEIKLITENIQIKEQVKTNTIILISVGVMLLIGIILMIAL